ncbi:MAG: hypothetical protein Q8O37_04020 [Sulfuricellaceae bacterium]|nr:hypothetical protein [Sulfuricellaceae bacterium]
MNMILGRIVVVVALASGTSANWVLAAIAGAACSVKDSTSPANRMLPGGNSLRNRK